MNAHAGQTAEAAHVAAARVDYNTATWLTRRSERELRDAGPCWRTRTTGLGDHVQRRLLARTAGYRGAVAHLVSRGDQAMWDIAETWRRYALRQAYRAQQRLLLDASELEAEVPVVTMQAALRYDPDRGHFSTHLFWWVRYGVQRAGAQVVGAVRVSPQDRRRFSRYCQAREAGADVREAAAQASLSVVSAQAIGSALRTPYTVYTAADGAQRGRDKHDNIARQEADGVILAPGAARDEETSPESRTLRNEAHARLRGALEGLPPVRCRVVCLFYGIEHDVHNVSGRAYTGVQIGEMLGMSAKVVTRHLAGARSDLAVALRGDPRS